MDWARLRIQKIVQLPATLEKGSVWLENSEKSIFIIKYLRK